MATAKKKNVRQKSASGKGQWRWLWLTFIVLILDLASKSMAAYYLSAFSSFQVFSLLNLVLVHNYGSAFGFLAGQNGWQLWLFVGIAISVSLAILTYLWRGNGLYPLTAAALSLILGGTLGNLYGRVLNGYVVDFLDFHFDHYHWPAFNIADSAICLGAFFLVLSSFRKA